MEDKRKLYTRNPQWRALNNELERLKKLRDSDETKPDDVKLYNELIQGVLHSMNIIELGLKQFLIAKVNPEAEIPKYATNGASGFDFKSLEDYVLEPGEVKKFSLGLAFSIPEGFELQLRGRSSLGEKGIGLPNGIGTIDSDYRFEVKVMLINGGKEPYTIAKGERICQGVYAPVTVIKHKEVEYSEIEQNGRGGFGSTGK